MTLKHNGETEFSECLEEFQVIVFYHLAILKTIPPIKTWALDMPAETFAGAPMLVKFGKGIPCEIPDNVDSDEDSSDTNAASSDAKSAIESVTTEVGSSTQLDINESEYLVLDHFGNDKLDSEDEDWVSVSSKDF